MIKHNVWTNGKTPRNTLRKIIQQRTFIEYDMNEIWYESAGKGSGAYRIRKEFIKNSLKASKNFKISRNAINKKFLEEREYTK